MRQYKVEILNSQLQPVARVQAFAPLDNSGHTLEYSTKLSDYGFCRFRVGTKDPLILPSNNGGAYLLTPYAYHVRVSRNKVVVWQGVIVDNPHRTKNYIEVKAYGYLFLLSNYLINRDPASKYPGADNYRQFDSGSMASVISTILTETKTNAGTATMSGLNIGQIDNPNFPAGYINFQGTDISGQAWTFSSNFSLKFDYRDILYVIQQLGLYSNFDFEIDTSMTFNFKSFIGLKQPQMTFTYGNQGNIADYDAPLNGKTMANHLWGVAADLNGNILKKDASDSGSITKYGEIQGVVAFGDVKNINVLQSRTVEQLRFTASPDSVINLTLNDKAYPLGQYSVGDLVSINLQDHAISFIGQRRIVMIDVMVHSTGAEMIRLATNVPRS